MTIYRNWFSLVAAGLALAGPSTDAVAGPRRDAAPGRPSALHQPSFLTYYSAGNPHQPPSSATRASSPAELVAQIARLLESNDVAGISALAERPAPFGWLRHGSRGASSGWKVALLPIPGPAGQEPSPAAIFYAFHTLESIGDHIFRLTRGPGSGVWRLGEEILETETLGYRVRDHRLTVRYDIPAHAASFTDDSTVERVREGAGAVVLRLSSDLRVDSAVMNGQPLALERAPGAIAFRPPADRTFTVSLTYHGTVNHPGSDYVNEREAVLVSYWYPHVARLPAKHGVTVTVPKGWLAVGEGELAGRRDDAETSTFTFRNEIPTCFFSLDAGPYAVTEREVDGRKLRCYELRPNPDRARRSLDQLARAMKFYDTNFGRFPYTHYDLVETIGPFGGALEAYSFATFAGGGFLGALAHELAHTWWGGVVPNPYTRTLWNESFANYSDGLFRRMVDSRPDGSILRLRSDERRGRNLIARYEVPVRQAFDTEDPRHTAVGYGKGSLVMGTLENLLGTPVMLQCLRAFYEGHPAGEAADWEQFSAVVRKTTGRDYDWFFAQWLDRPGLPLLKLANVTARQQGNRWIVEADLAQVQPGAPYRLTLPVVLQTEGGGMASASVETRAAMTHFQIQADAAPRSLTLDPEGKVLFAGAEMPAGADPLVFTFGKGE
jgi:aminopeptidase N